MNFFEHQRAAKKKTWLLVLLLCVAVLSLIALTVIVFAAAFHYSNLAGIQNNIDGISQLGFFDHLWNILQSPLSFYTALAIIFAITCASLFELHQLRRGGSHVAEALGARIIPNDTKDFHQRRVINVVEEMAIASGNPVPNVYLLREEGINAFAAGNNRRDCVIGITQGAIETLSRDELQGVIAHEFSHIHNGDTKINMRLVAIIFGLLVIGLCGRTLLNASARTSLVSRGRQKGINPLLVMGIALTILGYLGMFFGNVIKAAISRQREYLADASAVQFTRNNNGIGGALKKIGGFYQRSYLKHPAAFQFSHMYFSSGVRASLSNLFDTHPPLDKRITRIDPRWDRKFITPTPEKPKTQNTNDAPMDEGIPYPGTSQTNTQATAANTQPPLNFDASNLQSIENLFEFAITLQGIEQAKGLIFALPRALYNACHEASSARALCYLLLLSDDKDTYKKQLHYLQSRANPITFGHLATLNKERANLKTQQKLTLIEIAIAALQTQSEPQKKLFMTNAHKLLSMATRPWYEWCLFEILKQSLIQKKPFTSTKSLHSQAQCAAYLLYFTLDFIRSENRPQREIEKQGTLVPLREETIFDNAWKELGLNLSTSNFKKPGRYSFYKTEVALRRLSQVKPLEKPKLLKALVKVLTADGIICETEKAFFRAVCDNLDCPIPPLNLQ